MNEIKLELRHVAPYLPYGLKVQTKLREATEQGKPMNRTMGVLHGLYQRYGTDVSVVFKNGDANEDIFDLNFDEIKPILRPLLDLTKEIEHNGEIFVPIERIRNDDENDWFGEDEGGLDGMSFLEAQLRNHSYDWLFKFCPHGVIEKLHEWHFDTMNLIEQNLAIDLNSLTH